MNRNEIPKKGVGQRLICKNCGTKFSGNFCNHCGQKADIKRLNLHRFLHNTFHAFTHMDAGYLHTIKELAIRPGHTIREYLQGKRGGHSDPMLMLLIIGGICSILYNHYHLRTLASYDISELKGEMEVFSLKFFVFAFLGYSLLFALIDYLLLRFKEYNYFELLVMNIFACIEVLFFLILLVPVLLLLDTSTINNFLRFISFILILTYQFYLRYQFFEAGKDAKTLRRVVMVILMIALLLAAAGWKAILGLLA